MNDTMAKANGIEPITRIVNSEIMGTGPINARPSLTPRSGPSLTPRAIAVGDLNQVEIRGSDQRTSVSLNPDKLNPNGCHRFGLSIRHDRCPHYDHISPNELKTTTSTSGSSVWAWS